MAQSLGDLNPVRDVYMADRDIARAEQQSSPFVTKEGAAPMQPLPSPYPEATGASDARIHGLYNSDLPGAAQKYAQTAHADYWKQQTQGLDLGNNATIDALGAKYKVSRGMTQDGVNSTSYHPMTNDEMMGIIKNKSLEQFHNNLAGGKDTNDPATAKYHAILNGTDPSVANVVGQRLGLTPYGAEQAQGHASAAPLPYPDATAVQSANNVLNGAGIYGSAMKGTGGGPMGPGGMGPPSPYPAPAPPPAAPPKKPLTAAQQKVADKDTAAAAAAKAVDLSPEDYKAYQTAWGHLRDAHLTGKEVRGIEVPDPGNFADWVKSQKAKQAPTAAPSTSPAPPAPAPTAAGPAPAALPAPAPQQPLNVTPATLNAPTGAPGSSPPTPTQPLPAVAAPAPQAAPPALPAIAAPAPQSNLQQAVGVIGGMPSNPKYPMAGVPVMGGNESEYRKAIMRHLFPGVPTGEAPAQPAAQQAAAPAAQYTHTATGPNGEKIGTRDGGKTWEPMQ